MGGRRQVETSKPMCTRSQSSDHSPKQDSAMCDTESDNAESISDSLKTLITKTVQNEIQSLSESLNLAVDNNEALKGRINVLEKRLQLTEGLLQQAQIKLNMQNEKILDLQSRSMRENLVIRGISEDANESWQDTENKVKNFMKNEMKIEDTESLMVDRAHRMGTKVADKPRNIVVKFTSSKSKDKIFKNVKNLAGKKQFSVQEQLPQEIQERRNRLWPKFKEAKEKAKTDKTIKVRWVLDKLQVNSKTFSAKDDVQCINPSQHHSENVNVEHSRQISDQGSTFQGHAASLVRGNSVAGVLASLYANRSIANAEHNIYAYLLNKGDSVIESCCDDGEHGAGKRLLGLLQEAQATDTILVCTRWFGGQHIGPKRFDHIKQCASEALQKLK